jgi:hypothetical protein
MAGEDESDLDESQRTLAALRSEPSGRTPRPPPMPRQQTLPFGELPWLDFEKLIERLVELEGDPEYVSRYGTAGQGQEGIDIYSRLSGGTGYVVYQCKRYARLRAYEIRDAVTAFLEGKWSKPGPRFAGRFVFCTSHELAARPLPDEIETQAARLRAHQPPVVLDAWGQEKLSRELKAHPDLVEDFFGAAFVEAFSPGGSGRPTDTLMSPATPQQLAAGWGPSLPARPQVVITTLEWAPNTLQQILRHLGDSDPATFMALRDLVGEPPNIELVVSNITTPVVWLRGASVTTWRALSLMAEVKGEWTAAAAAWERTAGLLADDYEAAGALVSAASCANAAQSGELYGRLLDRARARFERHPRLIVHELQGLPPGEQLAALADAEARDDNDAAIVSAQRAMAYLMLPDLDEARRRAEEVAELMPGSTLARSVAVNVEVQRARLSQLEGRAQQAQALRHAHRDALSTRDQLLRQRRFEESARLLMLASDALALQGEYSDARELLMRATRGELATPGAAETLGDAALRALGASEALRLTEHAPASDEIRYIRAAAVLEAPSGTSAATRAQAVAELDSLVEAGGEAALQAAYARLADAMVSGEWSEQAEALLSASPGERSMLLMKAFWLGWRKGDWEHAWALFDDIETRWALLARLHVALSWGRRSVMHQAADELMAIAPGQNLRVACGRAYWRAGEVVRAREVFMSVAEDVSAPSSLRADAYASLVRIVGSQLDDWATAARLHEDWIRIRPGDTRASMFAPTIASRLRRQPELRASAPLHERRPATTSPKNATAACDSEPVLSPPPTSTTSASHDKSCRKPGTSCPSQ